MYTFVPVDHSPGGLRSVARLLAQAFPAAHHLTPPYLEWLYARNPSGPAFGVNALCAGEVVAHYAAVPFRARLFGTDATATVGLNLAVHPEHRGRRLAAEVIARTGAQAREAGVGALVAVLNANSTPVFTRTLGFQLVRPLEARIGVGGVARHAARATADFERCWDAATLAWRLANPAVRYAVHGGREVRAPSGLPGVAVTLGEVNEVPARRAVPRPALLRVWLGLDPDVDWARSLYVPIPMRTRPSPLNLVFQDAGAGARRLDADRVRFRGLDFDAY